MDFAIRAGDLYLKQRDTDKALENWVHVTSINPENAMCTTWRVLTIFLPFTSPRLLNPKKSTQNEVVSAVKAESVVAKVAAVNPSINTIAGIRPRYFKAIVGYR